MDTDTIVPVTHILPLVTIRRDRRLPVPGTVLVRVNERVQAMDVIATADVAPRHLVIDLTRALGIDAASAAQQVKRQPGDRLEAGDILAGPVGLTRRAVRAPADGVVVALSGAKLVFEASGEPFELKAGFPGMVTATDGTWSATIETTGALIQAAWGNGRQDFGVMRLVSRGPGDRLQTDQLDINLRGAVLIAGVCDHPAPLHQATELSVRGVVLGGMSAELIPMTKRLPYPVLVTEGFGPLAMSSAVYTLLSTNAGREAALDGRMADPFTGEKPEIIIPLPSPQRTNLPQDIIPLAAGVRVRVLRKPYHGSVGQVREVIPSAVSYPSGLLAASVKVDLDETGPRVVPQADIEIIQ